MTMTICNTDHEILCKEHQQFCDKAERLNDEFAKLQDSAYELGYERAGKELSAVTDQRDALISAAQDALSRLEKCELVEVAPEFSALRRAVESITGEAS